MLKESQKLHYVVTEVQGPSITVEFSDCKASLQLPMEKVKSGAAQGIVFCSEKTDLSIKYVREPMLREGLSLSAQELPDDLLGWGGGLHNARGPVEWC